MDRSSRRPRIRLTDILFLASLASASISLSSFQFITSNGIPLGCIVAYNNPLSGCTTGDFGEGNTCSAACVASIERIMANLASACSSIDPAQGSLLDLAVSGMLLPALCPNNDITTTASLALSTTTSSSARVTTTTLRFTTIPLSTTSNTLLSSFSSSSSSSSTPSNPAQSETTVAPTITTAASNNGGNNGGGVLTTSRSSSTSSAKAAQETQDFPGGVGSGSPFDPVQLSSTGTAPAGAQGTRRWKTSIMISLCAAAALMFAL